ncbi:MAG: bifunctional 5,10-methylenetetrahydrofolate dehydrogenase/5,10-methenyltetrahydrofolate cyclohydrolase [Verrucomicrobiaceae bacterium]|nr:MAG: bifunctional 5,10-methylenetetrahydrofolate dehydrogenase/5,10-methenyltetrahydrofolate cyclohydrolase [Verrucomicrobiaceae bacterium]
MSSVIDGKAVAAAVLEECRSEVAELKAKGITPGLAVVLVGDDPASHVYVGSKVRTCGDLGLYSRKIVLPAETTQEELLAVVQELNADPAIHGILVQSPPPKHIDEEAIIRALDPRKDVDGFHPENVAKLALEDKTGFAPCTPAGSMRLLAAAGVKTAGAEAVVIGRSMIVGKPMALLVGINRIDDASKKSGYRLVGDVAYDEVAPKCSAITPVPGGVGPMTIAMLMKNTLQAARQIGG